MADARAASLDPERIVLACRTFMDHELSRRVLQLRVENDLLRAQVNQLEASENDFKAKDFENASRVDDGTWPPWKLSIGRLVHRRRRDIVHAICAQHGLTVAFLDAMPAFNRQRKRYDFVTDASIYVPMDANGVVWFDKIDFGPRLWLEAGWNAEKKNFLACAAALAQASENMQ